MGSDVSHFSLQRMAEGKVLHLLSGVAKPFDTLMESIWQKAPNLRTFREKNVLAVKFTNCPKSFHELFAKPFLNTIPLHSENQRRAPLCERQALFSEHEAQSYFAASNKQNDTQNINSKTRFTNKIKTINIMKKFIATIKKAVKAVEEGNKQMTHYQALNPMSYYFVNRTMWC